MLPGQCSRRKTVSPGFSGRPEIPQLGGAGSGGGGTEDKVFLCKVTGGSTGAGYNVQLFAEGKDNASTGSGILYVAELALNSTIPAGSWIIGHRIAIQTTGGNET